MKLMRHGLCVLLTVLGVGCSRGKVPSNGYYEVKPLRWPKAEAKWEVIALVPTSESRIWNELEQFLFRQGFQPDTLCNPQTNLVEFSVPAEFAEEASAVIAEYGFETLERPPK